MNLQSFQNIIDKKNTAKVHVYTLGKFEVYVEGEKISPLAWKRDKSLQLLQFMLITRHRKALRKEQIIDRLWENEIDDQNFKVALHGISKALEPNKKSHANSQFIERNNHTYSLNTDDLWLDIISFDQLITLGNSLISTQPNEAINCLRAANTLYFGSLLPDRIYEDWTADEREKLQLTYLNTCTTLAKLLLDSNPSECIQLCQNALNEDITWEEAYRIQMSAYFVNGNRPMAIKTFKLCEKVLRDELDISPLPETQKVYNSILNA